MKLPRGDCPVCGKEVTLTIDGIPYQHRHPDAEDKWDHCLGSDCVGRYALLSLDDAQFWQSSMRRWRYMKVIGLA